MKDTSIFVAIIVLFAAFASIGALSANNTVVEEDTESVLFLKEANSFKAELLDAQEAALEAAHRIISKHDIADIDGSDEFAEYVELTAKVDSLLTTQL